MYFKKPNILFPRNFQFVAHLYVIRKANNLHCVVLIIINDWRVLIYGNGILCIILGLIDARRSDGLNYISDSPGVAVFEFRWFQISIREQNQFTVLHKLKLTAWFQVRTFRDMSPLYQSGHICNCNAGLAVIRDLLSSGRRPAVRLYLSALGIVSLHNIFFFFIRSMNFFFFYIKNFILHLCFIFIDRKMLQW